VSAAADLSAGRDERDGRGGLADALCAALLAAIGGAGFVAAFRAQDLARPLLTATLTGTAVSLVVTGILRRRPSMAALVAVPALVPAAVVGCGGGADVVFTGLRDGWWTILESAAPVRAEPPVLVVPFAVVAGAALLGAELAQRSRSPVAPVVPSLAALLVGLLLGAPSRTSPTWVPVAWVVGAALVVGLRTASGHGGAAVAASTDRRVTPRHLGAGGDSTPVAVGQRRPRRRFGQAAAATVLVLPVVCLAQGFGPDAPGAGTRPRFTLRDQFEPVAAPQPLTNPLVETTALQAGPDDLLFVAETSGPVARWRRAVLDTYDGREWRSQGTFLPAGTELAGPDSPAPARGDGGEPSGERVRQSVEVVGLDGQWLPVADRVVEISREGLLFDPQAGVLLVGGDGNLPSGYEAMSVTGSPSSEQLATAAVATDQEARRATAVPPDLPADFVTTADEITRGAASDYDRALAIERFFVESAPEAPFELATGDLPSGHTLGHLRCFLFEADRCARRGSAEQFVAAFALLARTAGLPARVVVGFDGSGAAGRDEVTAAEASAWAEVKFDGIGWVAFDPVPEPSVDVAPVTTLLPGGTGGPDASTPTTVAEPDDGSLSSEGGDTAAGDGAGSALQVALWAAGGLVVIAVVLLPGALRARRRRRRRRARGAAERLAGAWATAVDDLIRGGVGVGGGLAGLAVTDLVGIARQMDHIAPAGPSLADLGLVVNRAQFGAPVVDPADADRAWALTDDFTKRRRQERSIAQRLREYANLRR